MFVQTQLLLCVLVLRYSEAYPFKFFATGQNHISSYFNPRKKIHVDSPRLTGGSILYIRYHCCLD